MPGDDGPADTDKAQQTTNGSAASGRRRKFSELPKRIYAGLGVIAVVGGVIAFGTQVDNWFAQASASDCGISNSDQVQSSPNLDISFHQNNQVVLMSYENSTTDQVPVIDVCLSKAPFEIWFPALGPTGEVDICTYASVTGFRIDPFKIGQAAVGCLVGGTGYADSPFGSGALREAQPEDPGHMAIAGSRAEPASGGDDRYFVSAVYPVSPGVSPVSISQQTANLYLIIYSARNFAVPGADANVEHFVLRFK